MKPAELVKLLQQCIRRNPEELLAYYELALTFRALGRLKDMEKTLRGLLKREPKLSLARFLLSQAAGELGRTAEAEREQQAALALVAESLAAGEPEPEPLPRLAPDPGRPAPGMRLEDYKAAYGGDPNFAEVKYYEDLTTSGSINREQTFMLGLAYKRLGWYQAAISEFKQVLKAEPNRDEAYFELGNTFKHLGRFGDAAAAYRQALRINPKAAEAHFQLALACLKQGQIAEARKQMGDLRKLDTALAGLLEEELKK